MTGRPRLEVFEAAGSGESTTVILEGADLEDARLAAFEEGYTAGWDDAVAARNEEKAQEGAEIARSLQTLSFTYHEARAHVLRALEPLLAQMVAQFLPEVARAALPGHIASVLGELAEDFEPPVTILVNPAARPAVEDLLGSERRFPIEIREEPSLGEGQAWITLAGSETRLDLDGALVEMRRILADFFSMTSQEIANE